MTHFVCFRWGTLYPSEYVDRLYRSVEKYFSFDFQFHCFTDMPLALPSVVQQHELKMGEPFWGNWNKEYVFARDFLGLSKGTNVVVMDIDVLVTGSLNFVVTDHPDENLVMAPDGYKSRIGAGHGSVFRTKAGTLPHLWEDLLAEDYEALKAHLGGEREQHWLDLYYPKNKVTLFPAGRVVSFKYHCKSKGLAPFGKRAAQWGLTAAIWGKAQLPDDARVVCFHGRPDMEEVADGRWGRWRHALFVNKMLQKLD